MKQLIPALFAVGAVMALVGAAVFITGWVYAPYIYTIGAGFVALAQVNTPPGKKQNTPPPAHSADIRRTGIDTDRCIHVHHTRQRMDCLPHHSSYIGTLYSFSHSAGRGERAL